MDCPHVPGRWEENPLTFVYTKRCTRCGAVLHRVTRAEVVAARVPELI